jgi:hypothetical protein
MVLVLLMAALAALPQIGTLWTLEGLHSKSDVVAIATRVSTRDTGVRTTNAELKPPLPVVELETVFRIHVVLKAPVSGGTVGSSLTLRHFNHDHARLQGGVVNAGSTLVFDESRLIEGYLLFLRASSDGRYEPISGQVFPGISVLALHRSGR